MRSMFKNLEKEQKSKFKGHKMAARRKNKNKTRNSWNKKWRNSWNNLTFWKTSKIESYLVINQKYTGGINSDISNERGS